MTEVYLLNLYPGTVTVDVAEYAKEYEGTKESGITTPQAFQLKLSEHQIVKLLNTNFIPTSLEYKAVYPRTKFPHFSYYIGIMVEAQGRKAISTVHVPSSVPFFTIYITQESDGYPQIQTSNSPPQVVLNEIARTSSTTSSQSSTTSSTSSTTSSSATQSSTPPTTKTTTSSSNTSTLSSTQSSTTTTTPLSSTAQPTQSSPTSSSSSSTSSLINELFNKVGNISNYIYEAIDEVYSLVKGYISGSSISTANLRILLQEIYDCLQNAINFQNQAGVSLEVVDAWSQIYKNLTIICEELNNRTLTASSLQSLRLPSYNCKYAQMYAGTYCCDMKEVISLLSTTQSSTTKTTTSSSNTSTLSSTQSSTTTTSPTTTTPLQLLQENDYITFENEYPQYATLAKVLQNTPGLTLSQKISTLKQQFSAYAQQAYQALLGVDKRSARYYAKQANCILNALQQYSQLSGHDCLSELQQYIQELSKVNNVVYDSATQVQPSVLGTQPVLARPTPNIEILQ